MKISQLQAGASPNGTEYVPVVQNGQTVGLTLTQIAAMVGAVIVPGAVPVVWSPTDHSLYVDISVSRRMATRNNVLGGAWHSARSDTSQSSGIRSVQFTIVNVGGGGCQVGVCNGAESFYDYVGVTNNGVSYLSNGNAIKNAAFTGTMPGTYTTGDVIGMVVDLDAHTVKFNKNGGAYSPTIDITSLGADVFVACSLNDTAPFCSVIVDDLI